MQAALSPDVERAVEALSRDAREAARALAGSSSAVRDRALRDAAARMRSAQAALLAANAEDVTRARASGDTAAFIDRLTLTPARIEAMARGIEEIAALSRPVGESIAAWRRPNGLEIAQVRVPIGVVFTIYESRPNVTADSAALCLKTANAVLLKGGSESQATSAADRRRDPRRRRGRGPAAGGRAARQRRPRGGARAAPPRRPHRRRHRARWRDAEAHHHGREPHPGGEALRGHLPPVRRRRSGPRHGGAPLPERQGAAPERLQRHREPRRPRARGAPVPAAHRRGAARARLRGARRRGRAADRPRRDARPRTPTGTPSISISS